MIDVKRVFVAALVVSALVVAGCGSKEEPVVEQEPVAAAPVVAAPMVAVAQMAARGDLGVTGSVSFTQAEPDAPTMIAAHFEGMAAGTHGIHVHEIGDCSAEDFTSAGGHFNPMDVPHAGPGDAERHAGDLGNIECGEDGVCHLELESELLTVEEGPGSVVGRAVILHEKADDLVSQPTGAAGARLACGVVELAE